MTEIVQLQTQHLLARQIKEGLEAQQGSGGSPNYLNKLYHASDLAGRLVLYLHFAIGELTDGATEGF